MNFLYQTHFFHLNSNYNFNWVKTLIWTQNFSRLLILSRHLSFTQTCLCVYANGYVKAFLCSFFVVKALNYFFLLIEWYSFQFLHFNAKQSTLHRFYYFMLETFLKYLHIDSRWINGVVKRIHQKFTNSFSYFQKSLSVHRSNKTIHSLFFSLKSYFSV